MTHNEDLSGGSLSLEDFEAVKRSMLSTINNLQNETKLIFADAESALTAAKAVKKVSFMKEDIICQPDPIVHDYDNMDDNLRKETLQSYADRLTDANRELAMSNQRCAFAEKKLAALEAGQRRSREIIRTHASNIKDMLEVAFDQECERIVCVQKLSERMSVANDDRQKIIKQRDLFNEQLKEERRKNQLLKEENSKLKKNFTDVVEEKMEHLELKDELADCKKKSDKNDRDLKRIRKERDDLKQENSRILREQKRLTTEYENKFEKMHKEYSERLLQSAKKNKSTVEGVVAKATATINRVTEERDRCYEAYMKLLNGCNEEKELLNKLVKQHLSSNYPKTMKDLQKKNRDVETNMDENKSMSSPLQKPLNQLRKKSVVALKDLHKNNSDVESDMDEINQDISSTSESSGSDSSDSDSSDSDSLSEPYPTNRRKRSAKVINNFNFYQS